MNKTRNVAASVRQRLLNHSTTIKADPNLVLIWYGIERLPYRLSLSPHSDKFVLKGAMLFRGFVSPSRNTDGTLAGSCASPPDINVSPLDLELAPPAGVEPTTYRLGGGRSIH